MANNAKKREKKKIALFSGRFDPVHPSHWVSVLRLLRDFGAVKVVILDYKKRKHCAQYSEQVFQEMIDLSGFSDQIKVLINRKHFAKITRREYAAYGCSVYASGNMECINHLADLGMTVFYADRAYDYHASNYIPAKKIV